MCLEVVLQETLAFGRRGEMLVNLSEEVEYGTCVHGCVGDVRDDTVSFDGRPAFRCHVDDDDNGDDGCR